MGVLFQAVLVFLCLVVYFGIVPFSVWWKTRKALKHQSISSPAREGSTNERSL